MRKREEGRGRDQQMESDSLVPESPNVHERGDDVATGVVVDQDLPLVCDVFVGGFCACRGEGIVGRRGREGTGATEGEDGAQGRQLSLSQVQRHFLGVCRRNDVWSGLYLRLIIIDMWQGEGQGGGSGEEFKGG